MSAEVRGSMEDVRSDSVPNQVFDGLASSGMSNDGDCHPLARCHEPLRQDMSD